MYTVIQNNQIVIALLKEYGIRHVVISAGTRNIPFARSVENDSFFECYSVVDERSAAYFAMGISLQIGNLPVAICCTSSTATCNYFPAITESFYLKVPLLVLTMDRDPYYLGQMEDQMIQQVGMFKDVCRKSVNLPHVKNSEDFWYCERLVNEALLELDHRGKGPVHINIPTTMGLTDFSSLSLPAVKRIYRLSPDRVDWSGVIEKISNKKILVICGAYYDAPLGLSTLLEQFETRYNAVIAVDHQSNINGKTFLNLCAATHAMNSGEFASYLPDVVISFGGNFISHFKNLLRPYRQKIEHWLISENGDVVDVFKSLSNIFECSAMSFFEQMVSGSPVSIDSGKYYSDWKKKADQFHVGDIPFSNLSVIRDFTRVIPVNSILHLSVLNSIRLTNFFPLPSNVFTTANMGSHGIDGCMSTLLGQSVVVGRLSFLVIGDLSFFYDMNSLRIRHIGNNVRILLLNNGGGSEFQISMKNILGDQMDLHTAARHQTKAQAWAESVGFKYFSAGSVERYSDCLVPFVNESDRPILLEVFTDMSNDADIIARFYPSGRAIKPTVKISRLKKMIGPLFYHKAVLLKQLIFDWV